MANMYGTFCYVLFMHYSIQFFPQSYGMCVCEEGETIFSLIDKWGSKRNIACPGAQGLQVPEAEAEPRSAWVWNPSVTFFSVLCHHTQKGKELGRSTTTAMGMPRFETPLS